MPHIRLSSVLFLVHIKLVSTFLPPKPISYSRLSHPVFQFSESNHLASRYTRTPPCPSVSLALHPQTRCATLIPLSCYSLYVAVFVPFNLIQTYLIMSIEIMRVTPLFALALFWGHYCNASTAKQACAICLPAFEFVCTKSVFQFHSSYCATDCIQCLSGLGYNCSKCIDAVPQT